MIKPNYSLVLLTLVFVCAGCDTDRLSSQTGTWIGLAEPLTLYNMNGIPHRVLKLVIQEGTKMDDGGYNEGSFDTSKVMKEEEKGRFFSPTVVIVDKKYYAVDSGLYGGMRLKIRGTIEIASAIDSNDKSRLIWITPKFDPHPTEPTPAIIRAVQIDIIGPEQVPKKYK
jgi:hypothetical protein